MRIALANNSTRVTNEQADLIAQALSIQLAVHVCPAWEWMPAAVRFAADGKNGNDEALLTLFDTPDDPTALGYHYETPAGLPAGKVFVSPVLDAGGGVLDGGTINDSVAAVASHEAIELLGDLDCNVWVDGPAIAQGSCYAQELADPVEADAYEVTCTDGTKVLVSSFVLPHWFDPTPPTGVKYDYLGKLDKPFTLDAGGYFVVRNAPGSEQQVMGETAPRAWRAAGRAASNSRFERRTIPTPYLPVVTN